MLGGVTLNLEIKDLVDIDTALVVVPKDRLDSVCALIEDEDIPYRFETDGIDAFIKDSIAHYMEATEIDDVTEERACEIAESLWAKVRDFIDNEVREMI